MAYFTFTELQQKEIDEVLTSLNLGPREQRTYLTLLAQGQTTATPLAKALHFPVTTTQSILRRLVNFGLVEATLRKSRHTYEARQPTALRQLVESQLEDVKNIIPFLNQLQQQPGAKIKIKIYDRERMNDIFHDYVNCKSKIIQEIISPQDFQYILGERLHATKRRVEKGVFLKTLRVEKWEIKKYTKESHREKLREVKFLPRELTFQGSIVFWDDSVAFFSSHKEGLACVITSVSIREMVQQFFDLLWSISRPMETA